MNKQQSKIRYPNKWPDFHNTVLKSSSYTTIQLVLKVYGTHIKLNFPCSYMYEIWGCFFCNLLLRRFKPDANLKSH